MLWTEDLNGTVRFYMDKLGFTVNAVNEDLGWTSLSVDGAGIMLSRPNEHMPYKKIGFTGTFYFNIDDVEAMWAKLKDNTSICYGIETFEYGMREFAIFDNNGYVLQFGQEIDS